MEGSDSFRNPINTYYAQMIVTAIKDAFNIR